MFDEVLIADDDPISRRLLQVSLGGGGYQVTTATDGSEALRILSQPDSPRLAVLDWLMPSLDGVEVCRLVRSSIREPYLYIILLTAKGHQTEIVEGLEAGADDYVTKPFDMQELKARLRAGKRILELQEQLVAAREQLRIQATHDSLTGLLNRMAILEALDREAARCRRE
jgi:two-component system cell cycle response regulator